MKKKTPPVDIRKVIRAAAEAALEEPADVKPKKRRRSTGRALMLGAGLMTAGGLVASARGSNVLSSLHGSLGGLGVKLPGQNAVRPDVEDEEFEEPVEEALDDELDEDKLGEGVELEDEGDDETEASSRAPRRRAPRQRRGRA
jgi:hypothetical protein